MCGILVDSEVHAENTEDSGKMNETEPISTKQPSTLVPTILIAFNVNSSCTFARSVTESKSTQNKPKVDTSRMSTISTVNIDLTRTRDSADDGSSSANNIAQEKMTILSEEHLKALLAYVSVKYHLLKLSYFVRLLKCFGCRQSTYEITRKCTRVSS